MDRVASSSLCQGECVSKWLCHYVMQLLTIILANLLAKLKNNNVVEKIRVTRRIAIIIE